ncbi:ATP-dependent DNA ligase [Amnibacterium flavum]|uniref:DNA ligase (ATP) n=1 Tax=Amnibacterium flavum TaxID=2173173 RepID=A0A2V1HR26_9MICO|nr:ATP-dependent DNA ligase [Amnibacterium flavum]PVZ95066.1 ATP-dependent DNA ligase [Amnibacterium flavum]
MDIPEPMLAKAVASVPETAPGGGALLYEPKWDGFRAIVSVDGDDIEIGSRGAKPLTRYFPELVEAFRSQLPDGCVLDGEVVLRRGASGDERLDWETLSQRIHPAASRIARLSAETPASFVAFDLLEEGGESLLDLPFGERRARLEKLGARLSAPLHLTRVTDDVELARTWLVEFEGAGLDGVVAKPADAVYQPGKRAMLKIKHARTADCIVTGYRTHKSGSGVGSLLLSLYDSEGELRGVGGISAFTDKKRQELVDELEPYLARGEDGEPIRGEGERNRFSSSKDTSFAVLRPELVVEVKYDQMEGDRFRHTVQFARWRPDRDARSCTFDQLEVPNAYDLAQVLDS